MGVYNTLIVNQPCENCKNVIEKKIQFQFGDVWQFDYRLGDKIRWGGNDYGIPHLKRVKALGTGDECPICGYNPDYNDYDIIIEDDIIKEVKSAENINDYLSKNEDYIVLQE